MPNDSRLALWATHYHPLAPLLFTVSTMHCTTVSLAAGGEGLGAC